MSYGTLPEGSTWAMNPFPYSNAESPPEFDPPCNETVDRTKSDTGDCSGRDPFNTLLVDTLVVPSNVAPGDYVLSLRWFVRLSWVHACKRILFCLLACISHCAFGLSFVRSFVRACVRAGGRSFVRSLVRRSSVCADWVLARVSSHKYVCARCMHCLLYTSPSPRDRG